MKRIIIILVLMLSASMFLSAQSGRSGRGGERFDKDDVVKIKGTVEEVDHPEAIIKGDDGKEYEMRMGPIWFWKNNDYQINAGDKIEVSGEIENDNGKYYLYPFVINNNGKEIKLADEDGVPVWSRGGRGYGRSNDNRGYGRNDGNRGNGRGGARGYRCRW